MKSPTPLRNDKTVAAHGWASAAPAKISLWSKAQTRASKAKVSASVFQSTRRKGGVKIWLAEASAASSIKILDADHYVIAKPAKTFGKGGERRFRHEL